jgi:hypothetical protein
LLLWNVGRQSFYTAVQPRRQLWTSYSPPWELEISYRPYVSSYNVLGASALHTVVYRNYNCNTPHDPHRTQTEGTGGRAQLHNKYFVTFFFHIHGFRAKLILKTQRSPTGLPWMVTEHTARRPWGHCDQTRGENIGGESSMQRSDEICTRPQGRPRRRRRNNVKMDLWMQSVRIKNIYGVAAVTSSYSKHCVTMTRSRSAICSWN